MKTGAAKAARNKPEEALRQREAILAAIAQSAQKLLEAPNWRTEIQSMLALLGEASNASHAYLFENHLDKDMQLVTSQRYEWVGPRANPELHNPDYQNVPVQEQGMLNWYELMKAGKPFYDSTQVFKPEWATSLSRRNIKTLLDVPVFVDGDWWGVIGFDDCENEMLWSQAEVDALHAAAGLLGAAIKRQQADEALHASDAKFQTVFRNTIVPMIIGRTSDRLILDVNEAFCSLTGHSLDESLNRKGRDLNLWVDAQEYAHHRELIEKDGYIREFKAKYRKKSGEIGVLLLSVKPIIVNGEECLLYTLYDITKIEELVNQLQDKNNELEKFTYTVSHDLKAPLITIGGFVGYLERNILSGNVDKAKQDIQRIMDAVTKMQRLLNELLELSRIGRIVNEPENVPFGEIAEEAVRLVQGRLNMNQIAVRMEADLPVIYGDRARLVEVVQNLVDNAAKFMGDQPHPSIEIGVSMKNDGQVFFVRDNGIGIEPQYHERVFGLFNKLEAGSEGTGIGLALVKRIIEFHGGRVWIEPNSDARGTTFYFTLPAMKNAKADV